MYVIADVCVVPLGVGVSVSKYVSECLRIFEQAGLRTRLHAYERSLDPIHLPGFTQVQRPLTSHRVSPHHRLVLG